MKIKNLLFGIAVLALSTQVDAQSSKVQVGALVGTDLLDIERFDVDYLSYGFAGSYELGISSKFALVGDIGVKFWQGSRKPTMIPVQVGGRYFLQSQDKGVYAGLIGGINYTRYKYTSRGDEVVNEDQGYNLTPSVGYVFGKHLSTDLGVQYFRSFDFDIVELQLKAIYSFNL